MPKCWPTLTSGCRAVHKSLWVPTHTDPIFDMKLVLSEPYKLLQETEVSATQLLLDPLVGRMYEASHAPIREPETPTS